MAMINMETEFDSDDIDMEELERLEEKEKKRKAEQEVNSQAISGENAILRANIESIKYKHQLEINDLLQQNQRAKAEQERELESQRKEIERLRTESQFLQNDLSSLYRAKQRPVEPDNSNISPSASPRRNKATRNQTGPDFEAMFRSGFDNSPISPRRKKVKTVIIDPPSIRKRTREEEPEQVQTMPRETVFPIIKQSHREIESLRSAVLQCEFPDSDQRAVDLIPQETLGEVNLAILGMPESNLNFSNARSQLLNLLCACDTDQGYTHVITFLIQSIAETQPNTLKKDQIEKMTKYSMQVFKDNADLVTGYERPASLPPTEISIEKRVVYATANVHYSLALLKCLACFYPNTTFESLGVPYDNTFLSSILSPRLPSNILVRAMEIICLQPLNVTFDLFYRFLSEVIPAPSTLLLFTNGCYSHLVHSESTFRFVIRERFQGELHDRDIQLRNERSITKLKIAIIRRMALVVIDEQSPASIIDNVPLLTSIIYCLSHELDIEYNSPTITRCDKKPEYQHTGLRIQLIDFCVQLLHGVWNMTSNSINNGVLSRLEAQYAYKFTVALAQIAFSSHQCRFNEETVNRARDLLEQCTTLSEADDIYMSMNST